MIDNQGFLSKVNKIIRSKWFQLISGFAILVFVFFYFRSIGGELDQIIHITSPIYFVFALPFIFIALIAHVLAWRLIVKHFGPKLNFWNAIYIYTFSNLTRYIPGNYWHIFFKSTLGSNFGVDIKTGVKGAGIELVLNAIVGFIFVVFGIFLKFVALETDQLKWLLLFFIVSIFILALFLVINKIADKKNNSDGSEKSKVFLVIEELAEILKFKRKEIFQIILLFSIAWLSQGFTLWFSLSAWDVVNVTHYGVIMFSYVTAWFMGFINPIAQNGLGVREAVSIVALSNLFPVATILGANLAMRLFGLLAELVLLLLSFLLRSDKSRSIGKRN